MNNFVNNLLVYKFFKIKIIENAVELILLLYVRCNILLFKNLTDIIQLFMPLLYV